MTSGGCSQDYVGCPSLPRRPLPVAGVRGYITPGKLFYSSVNKRLSHKSGITVVTDSNGVNLSDDGDIANPFTDYFASAGVPSNHSIPHCRNPEVPSLDSIDIVEHDIMAAIDKL